MRLKIMWLDAKQLFPSSYIILMSTCFLSSWLCSMGTSKISPLFDIDTFKTLLKHVLDIFWIFINCILNFVIYFYVKALRLYFLDACRFYVYFTSLNYMFSPDYKWKLFSIWGQPSYTWMKWTMMVSSRLNILRLYY